ncbi:MAG: hypothetical protein BGO55_08325 [Sphingobacteriales bacterium 50-39]|nr:hypothetical protein [Sphingobacteriales bacterium]OJW59268.1 MAG: hypothetical protein BGO55_08325 [Sphingobacteriales bacterium 50-39]
MKEDNQLIWKSVGDLIKLGSVKTFPEIFHIVRKSNVARRVGINNVRFSKLINKPRGFKLEDIDIMAGLFFVKPMDILRLIYGPPGPAE